MGLKPDKKDARTGLITKKVTKKLQIKIIPILNFPSNKKPSPGSHRFIIAAIPFKNVKTFFQNPFGLSF